MSKGRMEAFTDGVMAIIITIMVLELQVPHGADLAALLAVWPVFLSYVLSFIYVGIYWNNHHHMLQASRDVSSRALWANLHLLFWLSLLPFSTAWMGDNHFASVPVALLAGNLLLAALAYSILMFSLIRHHGPDSKMARAIGRDNKGKISLAIYVASILSALFVSNWLGFVLLFLPAALWLIPDRRMERAMPGHD
ncbi:MAG: TMEM175 family protein [Paracoccaceae bacterium]